MNSLSEKMKKACSECQIIIQALDEDLKNRIEKKFLKFIDDNSIPEFVPSFNINEPLDQQKLLPETYALISIMYIKYLCDNSDEKSQILNLLKK